MRKQLIYSLALITFTTTFFFLDANKALASQTEHYTKAEHAYIIDYDTGMVLLDKKADQKMPTSSMSKIMTMYMVFDALEDGRISLNDELPVSEKAWRKGGSKMFVEVGDKVKVEDLIRGVIVQSGNDATIVLAEALAANEAKFAEIMTQKAYEIGAVNSNFFNASGWPHPEHYSTARDLTLIARRIISEFPQHYHYYSKKSFTYNDITQNNRNPLLYQNIGADGLKTGHTEIAGYGLIGSGKRDGRRVIMVLNGLDSKSERAKEGRRLLSWALRSFENIKVFSENESVISAPVILGTKERIDLVIPQDIIVTVPKGERENIKVTLEYNAPLKAPVEKGTQLGKAVINVPQTGRVVVPLLAGESSEKKGFVSQLFAKAQLLLMGPPALQN